MRKIGSDARSSPTIAVLAASTTPFASSTACCACSRETSVVARDFRPSSVASMSLSRAGSLSTSVGFIESYSSAIGWVACTRASSALPSSRFCSSAQKCPSVSSRPAAKSTLSRSSDSTPPAPFANAAGAAAVAATAARASPTSAAVPVADFTRRRPALVLIRGGLKTRSCNTSLQQGEAGAAALGAGRRAGAAPAAIGETRGRGERRDRAPAEQRRAGNRRSAQADLPARAVCPRTEAGGPCRRLPARAAACIGRPRPRPDAGAALACRPAR